MIGVLHAYSSTNAGDGLLVELTLERLRRVGVGADDVVLVALDPDSFPDLPRRERLGTPRRRLGWDLVPAVSRGLGLAASAGLRRPVGRLARALADCDGLVAVGGGYLRAVDGVSSAGAALNHLPQLLAAGRSGVPSIYLPQSVGPLRGPVGRAVAAGLRHVDVVCVRDDASAEELVGRANVRRVPDLAVLDVAERWDVIESVGSGGKVALVARQVKHAPGYEEQLRELAGRWPDRSVWAVQSEGDATKSDRVHYQRLGIEPEDGLAEMLARRELSVVVSVRLHGALMAVEAGVPAIHLAYDRKGPAAFGDLGLAEWCHDIRSFDADRLARAVGDLLDDPSAYWDRLSTRLAELRTASADLDDLVRVTLGRAAAPRGA